MPKYKSIKRIIYVFQVNICGVLLVISALYCGQVL